MNIPLIIIGLVLIAGPLVYEHNQRESLFEGAMANPEASAGLLLQQNYNAMNYLPWVYIAVLIGIIVLIAGLIS